MRKRRRPKSLKRFINTPYVSQNDCFLEKVTTETIPILHVKREALLNIEESVIIFFILPVVSSEVEVNHPLANVRGNELVLMGKISSAVMNFQPIS